MLNLYFYLTYSVGEPVFWEEDKEGIPIYSSGFARIMAKQLGVDTDAEGEIESVIVTNLLDTGYDGEVKFKHNGYLTTFYLSDSDIRRSVVTERKVVDGRFV